MIDEHNAVIGDGVITIPVPVDEEKLTMPEPIDLPSNVASAMMAETAGNIQASNRNSRFANDAVMSAISGTVQTNFAEIGVMESRAASGVIATPIASPTTQAGA